MVVKKRLLYVDAFRGLAIVLMVFLNVFDYVSVYDIHTEEPFYILLLNSVTILPPILLFSFVSGMSALLLTDSVKKKTLNFLQFIKKVTLRYGKYFLLSIPFTFFMWGLKVFYTWEEAIQGLSISSIITCLILYYVRDKRKLICLTVIIYLLQSFLLFSWRSYGFTGSIPFSDDFTILGLLVNLIFRGWFSISNLVPFMLVGAVFLENFRESRVNLNILIALASFLVVITLWPIVPVDYYMRSFTLIFYVAGMCGVITSIIYYLTMLGSMFKILRTFGLVSFEAYILHFLLAKAIRLLGMGDALPFIPASIISFSVLLLFYIIGSFYIKTVKKQVL
ncbi:Acyltransferase family protein [Candidatus Tiddalikarchaeum anstoanum]|nr:Acyltransferase family protein [Candidatus Tiddalikarchaeum anstoanum]